MERHARYIYKIVITQDKQDFLFTNYGRHSYTYNCIIQSAPNFKALQYPIDLDRKGLRRNNFK